MKSQYLLFAVIITSSLLLTSCQKDGLTKIIDAEYSLPLDTNNPSFIDGTDDTEGIDDDIKIISTLNAQLEASLSVRVFNCPGSERSSGARSEEGKPDDCNDIYVASGYAYGTTEEFGLAKAELTIKYDPSKDQITGEMVLQMESAPESLTILFGGQLSDSTNENLSRFRGLSSQSFYDKYFTGFVSIQDLEKLLRSKGLKNLPVNVSGVFE